MNSRPFIIEIHIIIHPMHWGSAKNQIIRILKAVNYEKYKIIPLYMTSDIEDYELRICCQIEDPNKLDKFVNQIRKISGINSTRIRLTLNGVIFPKGVQLLAQTESKMESCHIFLKIEPGKDENVWNKLLALKDILKVYPTWIFRDFYEYDRDVTLRLMGESKKEIRKYIDQYVSTINGICHIYLKFMYKMTPILSLGKLKETAKYWTDKKG